MKGWKVGYIRVSTLDQNTDRQLSGVELDRVYTDKCSGSTKERPELKRMIEDVREGDEIFIHDISRAARNLQHLNELVQTLTKKGVTVNFVKENLRFTGDKSNPMEELLLNLLGAVYQFERSIMLERQREGIAKAKARGKYKGRPKSIDPSEILDLLSDGMSMRKVAKELGVSLSSVQRAKKVGADTEKSLII